MCSIGDEETVEFHDCVMKGERGTKAENVSRPTSVPVKGVAMLPIEIGSFILQPHSAVRWWQRPLDYTEAGTE